MKKLLSLILSLVMIFFISVPGAETLSASAVSIDDSETVYPSFTSKIGNPEEALQEYVSDVQQFTDYIVPHIKNCETQVDVRSYQIVYSSEALKAISNYIYYYLVELYHVASVGVSISSGKIYHLTFSYKLSAEEYGRNFEKIETVCAKLLEGLDSSTLSDKDKALLIHDRLAQYCEYDYENYLNGTPGEYSSSIYGALAEGYAVCSGYARSYMYLLRQVGIKSYVTSSDTLSHEWNIVYLDGVKYHVDVTWDDPVRDIYGRVNHDSFLRSTQGISTVHNASDYDTSPVDTTYDSEYWQSSYTGFQLVNGEIFFFNSSSKTLCKVTDSGIQELASLPYKWYLPSGGYYSKSYVTLAGDGENLFFSTPKAIYRYDTATDTYEEYYAPELQNGFNIYGFKIKDGYFCLDINNSQSITSQDRANYSVKYHYMPVTVTYDYSYNYGDSADVSSNEYFSGDSVDLSVKAYKDGWDFLGWNTDVNASSGLDSFNAGDEDVTLYALFSKDITVKFVSGEAENPSIQEINTTIYNKEQGYTTDMPAPDEISGWTAQGWSTKDSLKIAESTNVIKESTVYYAVYSKQITVSYDADGGEGVPAASVYTVYYNSCGSYKNANHYITSGEIQPVREGFRFVGWKVNNEGAAIRSWYRLSVHEDTVIHAAWYEYDSDTADITISFIYLNEDFETEQLDCVYTIASGGSAEIVPPEIPEIDGWEKYGWRRIAPGPTDDFIISETGSRVFSALYIDRTKITFDSNGGAEFTNTMNGYVIMTAGIDEKVISSSVRITDQVPERIGYTFMGWSASPSAQSVDYKQFDFITFEKSMTLYAVWSSTAHKVTYIYPISEGSLPSIPNNLGYEPGEEVCLSYTLFAPLSWTFMGWTTDPDGTDVLSSLVMGDEDIILYAVFLKLINAGFVNLDEVQKVNAEISKNETHVTIDFPEQKSLEGWTPIGWAKEKVYNSQVYNGSYDFYESQVFYGVYAKAVSLNFYADGASNVPERQTGNRLYYSKANMYDAFITIQQITPVKPGYIFMGWTDVPGSQEVKYYNSDIIQISEDKDLYAVFAPDACTVYFNAGPGLCDRESQTVITGQSFGKLPVPVRDGYIFAGWYTESGDSITSETVFNHGRDITLYAKWNEALKINPESGINSDSSFLYFESAEQLKNLDISSLFLNENVEVESNGEGNDSTGAIVTLKNDSGEIQDTRTVVLRGDVNGDLCVDARDSVIVNCIIGGMLTPHAAVLKAADTNTDGIVNVEDANNLVNKGLFKN